MPPGTTSKQALTCASRQRTGLELRKNGMGYLRGFTLAAMASGLECPRCGGAGIERITVAMLKTTSVADQLPHPEFLIPSAPVRCTACGLAGDRWGFLPAAVETLPGYSSKFE
ncbi:MAG: hypothetical protein IPG98_16845 [Burkholderiales bacterium]|nr:hypothetical protein [Burkholderiales bacterium]MBK8666746.1 hypothetical protein [Burkholderiales bacterium]MBK8667074.1 hypothetical protein [Burkholderiales bacterium]